MAGRYRLSVIVGRGGMGVVWQARDELLDRDVAVKEICWPPHLTELQQQAACHRASAEAQLAARLNHRNVIRVFDIVEEDGYPWIVMELLPYRSLRDLVEQEGPLTPVQAARVGLGILAALRAAHAAGILHRDVKPANVLVGPERVVLTDFGIACAADSTALPTASALMGSPSYIAPERATGRRSGAPADLWGLGASLYAAVEGRPPFDRDDALASLTAVVNDEPDPAEHTGPLGPVISGLLRKDPRERLGAAETAVMLTAVADGSATELVAVRDSPVRSGSLSFMSRGSRGPLVAMARVAALVVLAASGTAVGFALTNSPHQQVASAGTHPSAVSAPLPAAITRPRVATAGPTAGTRAKTHSGSHLTAQTSRHHAHRHGPAAWPSSPDTGHGASWVSLLSKVESHFRDPHGWHHHWQDHDLSPLMLVQSRSSSSSPRTSWFMGPPTGCRPGRAASGLPGGRTASPARCRPHPC